MTKKSKQIGKRKSEKRKINPKKLLMIMQTQLFWMGYNIILTSIVIPPNPKRTLGYLL